MGTWKKILTEDDVTNTNLGNSDLTSSSPSRTFTLGSGDASFTIKNEEADEVFKIVNTSADVVTTQLAGGLNIVEDYSSGPIQGHIKFYEGASSENYFGIAAPTVSVVNQYMHFPRSAPSVGQVIKVAENGVNGTNPYVITTEWADASGTNTNIAISNLTATDNRTLDMDGNSLLIDINGGDFTVRDTSTSYGFIQAGNTLLRLGDAGVVVTCPGNFQAEQGVEQDEAGLTAAGNYGTGADITFLGASTSAVTAGRIYYYNGTTWAVFTTASEAPQKAILGMAVGSTMASGFILKGFIRADLPAQLTAGTLAFADSTFGRVVTSAPTSGFQRILGHTISGSVIYFNPSAEYIDLA